MKSIQTPMATVTSFLQFQSRTIVQYNHFDRGNDYSRSFKQKQSAEELKTRETYTGVLCPGAKKRLNKAIEILVDSAEMKTHTFISKRSGQQRTIKFDLNYITLTIYSTERNVKGKEAAKLCLEPLLLWMYRKYNCTMYIWKAELQERGQLHYHITSDTFIPYEALRLKWNELQKEAGYLDSFHKKYGHWQPHGTDVHSVYKVKNVAEYLKKCIIKEYSIQAELNKDIQNKESIGGKVWDCSLNLKAAAYFRTDGTTGTEKYLQRAVRNKEVIKVETDHCNIYRFERKRAKSILSQFDRLLYKEHIENIKSYKRRSPTKRIKLNAEALEELEICNSLNKPVVMEPQALTNEKTKLKKVNFKVIPSIFSDS